MKVSTRLCDVLVDMNGQGEARIIWPRMGRKKSEREGPYSFILKDRIWLGKIRIESKKRKMSSK